MRPDCLFIPGIGDPKTIGTLVNSINGPLNVVMGLSHNQLTVEQLRSLGVRRISIGGSLARACFHLIRQAALEIMNSGTFTYADHQYSQKELCDFFAEYEAKTK
ncbi:isocitrate lyase/phosphoenolpyruvate mutase family protein [Leptospira johnsonii]|uniref:isocitrate lyase/phosphoenolpyruvate mutase family protein n=1 Tax=Leptospira johnsonii TaxID=1917820 RepID=UPI001FE68871|nr:isocitrate lyase/phosphoenolpyruvate mutase family protein [Leptospira johnsonii]